MSVGYLGPAGTFSEEAVDCYLRRHPEALPKHPVESFPDLFLQLQGGRIATAIIPIENSVEGMVPVCLDLLASSPGIYAIEEMVLRVRLSLLARPDVTAAQITDIVSHPQPLAQCHHYLRKQFPRARLHSALSTAIAAEQLAENRYLMGPGSEVAVIGRAELARLYELDILLQDIQDSARNATRFWVIAPRQAERTGADKTSIVFSTPRDVPGSLHRVLGIFSERGINLTGITSRPAKTVLGEYLFFVDLDGHIQDDLVAEALEQVKTVVNFYKLLGSYRKDESAC